MNFTEAIAYRGTSNKEVTGSLVPRPALFSFVQRMQRAGYLFSHVWCQG